MLKVDLRGPGGLILAALAFLAAVAAVAVLILAALEFQLNGRRVPLVIALVGSAAAWLVGSMTLKRLGASVLRPEAPQGLAPEEAAARLPQRLEEYRRLRR
jgi:hypothetical protein